VENKTIKECIKKLKEWIQFNDSAPKNHGIRQGYEEITELCSILKNSKPHNICLETGLYYGGTHFLFKQLFDKVISIDMDPSVCRNTTSQLSKFGCDMNTSEFICGDSMNKDTLDKTKVCIGEGNKVDFLFIDGGHNFKVMKSDFELYAPLVRAGGIIAIPDAGSEEHAHFPPTEPSEFYWQVHSAVKYLSHHSKRYNISKAQFIKIDYTGIAWFTKK